MTTRELITYMQSMAGSYSRPVLLSILNDIQFIVYSNPNYQAEYINPSTGMPPFLATTNLVHGYDAPADSLRVLGVFAKNMSAYNKTNSDRAIKYIRYNGYQYYEVPVNDKQATSSEPAKVIFVDNPGTTTTTYYLRYTQKPAALASEAIELTIPERWHMDLAEGVLARISKEKYGDRTAWQNFMMTTLPSISGGLNDGLRPGRGTPTQPEYNFYRCR